MTHRSPQLSQALYLQPSCLCNTETGQCRHHPRCPTSYTTITNCCQMVNTVLLHYILIVSYTLHYIYFQFKASFQYCPLSLQLDLQAHLQMVLQLDLHLDLHADLQVILQSNLQDRGPRSVTSNFHSVETELKHTSINPGLSQIIHRSESQLHLLTKLCNILRTRHEQLLHTKLCDDLKKQT